MSPRMRRFLFPLAVLVALASSVRADLQGEIELAITGAGLSGATIAVSIIEAGSGTMLVSIDDERMMIPASNLKLLTTGAALHVLGADFRFQTRLLLEDGRLRVVGDGDPAFGDPELLAFMTTEHGEGLDVDGFIRLWTDAVVETGVGEIAELVVDDRVFDRQFVQPTWPRDQLNRRYAAQVSGLNFHLNQLHFYPEPRSGQRPSLSRFDPQTSRLKISNNATSKTGASDGDTAWIARRLGTNDLTFYGNVKHRYRAPVPVTAHDMPLFFGELLAERLRAAGVQVRSVRLASTHDGPSDEPGNRPGKGAGKAPGKEPGEASKIVGPVIYTPIATVVTRCNRDSQNLFAESLLKRMGHAMTGQPGSWLNGASIVRHVAYERLESPRLSSRIVIADGSGLSRDNRVAPASITDWLNSFHNDEKLGAVFVASLAVGGLNGTLEKRLGPAGMSGAEVRAKSGYINEVSCLSGYVTARDGQRRCFSIMINDLTGPVRRAKQLQDRIVEAIAASMTPAPVTLGGE